MDKTLILLSFLFLLVSCGDNLPACQECIGATADWTICDNEDGTVTKTNNLTNETTIDSASYLASIVFLETLDIDCN